MRTDSRSAAKWIVPVLLLCLAGCGGVATTLTGGSVPVGGRAITGTVLLPDGTPVATGVVTVRALSSGQLLQTTTTDAMGRFAAAAVPVNADLDVTVTQPPANSLELVIPHGDIMGRPEQPFDVGQITALSTLVAAAIKLEQAAAPPEDADHIAGNQAPGLTARVHRQGFSESDQQRFINDPNHLRDQALTELEPTANDELAAFTARPTTDTATAALNGLLGNVRAGHGQGVHLSQTLQTALINAALSGKQYTADMVAAALQAGSGHPADAAQVMTASQKERHDLPALATSGAGISPFEALAIGGDSDPHGGFHLEPNGLNDYLTTLLNHG